MNKVNKKGFTLVELLAVIVLMAILVTVAVPGVSRIGNSLKVQSFCSKINIIESAALEYANDYYTGKEVNGSSKVSLDNVSLMDLINMGYLKADSDIVSDLKDGPCVLYNKDSKCLSDPRTKTSMDYNLVRIWTANNRIYATYRYLKNDVDNEVCGDNTIYEVDDTASNSSTSTTYNLETFGNATRATIAKENGKYSWTNYKNFRTFRPDNIPGTYYISSVSIKYSLGQYTRLELKSGDIFTANNLATSGNSTTSTYTINNLKSKYLSNLDISYRVAINSDTRVSGSEAKIEAITVNWTNINN